MAEKVYLVYEEIGRYERGKHKPSTKTIERLARILNTNVGYLTGEFDEPIPDDDNMSWRGRKLAKEIATQENLNLLNNKIVATQAKAHNQRLSPFFNFIGYDVQVFPNSITKFFDQGVLSRDLDVYLYPFAEPDEQIRFSLDEIDEIVDDICEYAEFLLLKAQKKKSKNKDKEDTDNAEEE